MNKTELVEVLAERHCGGNRSEAMRLLNAVVETIIDSTADHGRVSITGFGVFETVQRPARMVRNPRTGERTRVGEDVQPRFRPGSRFVRSVEATQGRAPVPRSGPVTTEDVLRPREPVTREDVRGPREPVGVTG